MTTGSPHVPQGQEMRVRRRWWRQAQFVPLVLLVILSLAAIIVGRITSAELAREASEVATPFPEPSASVDAVASVCRPPLRAPAQEPWFDDRDAAEAVWARNAPDAEIKQVVGPNGWIFWNDAADHYAAQAVGRETLSSLQVRQWIDHFTAVRDEMVARGIEFYVVVTPSTSSIYPEELPEWMQELRGSTIMDQVMAAADGLPIIDLRADLIAQKTEPVHLFSWSNSHWTDYGAYLAWKQIAACVNTMRPGDRPLRVPEITGTTVVGDFNEWAPFGVSSPGADWAVPDYAEQLAPVTRTDAAGKEEVVTGNTATDLSILPVTTTVADSWTGKSALIFRDSMGGGLSPMWQQAYSPTWQVKEPYITDGIRPSNYAAEVEAHHPDVVIVQLAERYLINPPPQGYGY